MQWEVARLQGRQNSRKIVLVWTAILLMAGVVFFLLRATSPDQMHQAYLSVSGVVDDVSSRVRGQIGVRLGTDAATGLPVVESLLRGSPAEQAGLRLGDVISHVNHKSLSGVSLVEAGGWIRGLSGGSVELRIRRADTTNALNLTIQRASVKALNSL
jgi:carboxyl-terminal processing protease